MDGWMDGCVIDGWMGWDGWLTSGRYTDKNFNVDAYFWVVVWYAVFSFDQVRVVLALALALAGA